MKPLIQKTVTFLTQDALTLISFALTLLTSLIHQPNFAHVDWKVIASLFALMLIVKGLEESGLLETISTSLLRRSTSTRMVLMVITLLSFFISMFLTNDVAILTFLPLLYSLAKKSDLNIVVGAVLITIAANLGSAATPLGNPQNLFLFSHFNLNLSQFLAIIMPFSGLSLVLIIICVMLQKSKALTIDLPVEPLKNKPQAFIFLALGALVISSVLNIFPYPITTLIVAVACIVINKDLFQYVDYHLLLTFIFLFIAINNIASFESFQTLIASLVDTQSHTYLTSIVISQFISNVPAAILLAPFTQTPAALLIGVNVGGLGTLIASMANLLALKSIQQHHPQSTKKFIASFTLYNFVLLALLGTLVAYFFL